MSCELFLVNYDLFESIGILVLVIVFQFAIYPTVSQFIGRTTESDSMKRACRYTKEFIEGLLIKPVSKKGVIISIGTILLLDFLYVLLSPTSQFGLRPEISVFTSVFFHPVWEELFYRGILLGGLIAITKLGYNLIEKLLKIPHKKFKPIYGIMTIIYILLTAYLFGLSHNALLQFYQGLLFAYLFVGDYLQRQFGINKKILHSENNIILPIIAHATHNTIIAIIVCLNITF